MNQNDQMMREALRKSFTLGQRYWQQADSDYESEHKKSDETHQKYRQLVEETLQALAAEPAPPVRLTDDDVMDAYSESSLDVNARLDDLFDFANVLQDAWIKKNGGQQ